MNSPLQIHAPRSKHVPISYERVAILLAVATGPIDRRDIEDVVMADSVGAIFIKKSTLYYLISELIEYGLMQHQGSLTLTDKGWRALHNEFSRIEQQRRIMKQRLHI